MSARQLTTKFTATWLWSTTVGRLSVIPGGGLYRRADLNWEIDSKYEDPNRAGFADSMVHYLSRGGGVH